jgi:CRISPR/Cas system-associated endoribonuclease Cas2
VRHTLGQRVFLHGTYVKYGSAGKCRRKFRRKFRDKRARSRQTIQNSVNELKTTGLLIGKIQKRKRRVLTEKLDEIRAWLEHTPRKSLKRLTQGTGVSNSSGTRATQLLKLRPYKTTVIHALLAVARPSWQGSFLQLVSTVCHRRWDRSAVGIFF